MIKNKISEEQDTFFRVMRGITKYGFFSIIALFAGYVYLVGGITFSVIQQRELADSLHTENSDISQSEISYLQKEKDLTKEYAQGALGLVPAASIAYTQRSSSLAFNAN